MAKFVFRMQNILNIKLKMETQAKFSFAAAASRVREQEELLDEMFKEKRQLEDAYRNKANGGIKVRELTEAKASIDFQIEKIKIQIIEVNVARKNLEAARIRLNEAMKERKIYEKLREKKFEEFLQEQNDEEKKVIDELVSYKYGAGGTDET